MKQHKPFYKKILFTSMLILTGSITFAQRDIIYKKSSNPIRCRIIKETRTAYEYAFVNSFDNSVQKTKLLKSQIDSTKLNAYDNDLATHFLLGNAPQEQAQQNPKPWQGNASIGLTIGNILEFNAPGGGNKKSFTGSTSIDATTRYRKEGKRLEMSHELHYLLSILKPGFSSGVHLQKAGDALNTLHDISYAFGKSKKWNFNLITKTTLALFTTYNNDNFKDYALSGRKQAFLSPYDVTISPGIKYQPNQYLRISASPYSFNLYGIKHHDVRIKGIYITDVDAAGNYKNFLFKRLGAEVNVWFDKSVKNWLMMQYRVGVSSNYFERIARNGLLNGQFYTKIKIIKNIYLDHRAVLNADFSVAPLKPYFNQAILISYAKSFQR